MLAVAAVMKPTFKTTLTALLMSAMLAGSAAATFHQASSTDEQLATDTNPKVVTMNATDAASGMTNEKGVVTVSEDLAYFLVAAG
jgi:hypothetical protein